MLIPAFQFALNHSILPGLATVGKYDGKAPQLTCATDAGKIFVHNPHERNDTATGARVNFLSVNKQVNAICAGPLNPALQHDILCVGMQNQLLLYDVENNQDLQYKEVPDGINDLIFGYVGNIEQPLAIVGGNCSIQGFDFEGQEKFWTVTGDIVSSLALCDVEGDGQNELLVGSEDFEIRVFQNEEVISEITESDKVCGLCDMRGTKYGFCLGNGTIGVYDKVQRLWKKKQKHKVQAIRAFDLDGDGVPELVTGLANGRLEVRNDDNGELIYKDSYGAGVAAIVAADYHLDSREEVIVCCEDGEVRGYLPAEEELGGNLMDVQVEESVVRELNQRKQELIQEQKHYDKGLKDLKSGTASDSDSIVPPDTQCQAYLSGSKDVLSLILNTNNDSLIKAVCVFAENIFDEADSYVVHPKNASSSAQIPLAPKKDVATELTVKAMLGTYGSNQFILVEFQIKVPKFAMYVLAGGGFSKPTSQVQFSIPDRTTRAALWLKDAFNLPEEAISQGGGEIQLQLISLRNKQPLSISFIPGGNGMDITFSTEDMELAGELVQDLCNYMQVHELTSVASFPAEMRTFEEILQRVEEYNTVRMQLTAEMADRSNTVKMLVVKAEDSRILGDMPSMKDHYAGLWNVNNELLAEYKKRHTNHTELLECLKEVNQMIQKAARLRVGSAKTQVVAACRAAIKSNNIQSLFKIIQMGDVAH